MTAMLHVALMISFLGPSAGEAEAKTEGASSVKASDWYPEIAPFKEDRLKVSDIHEIRSAGALGVG